MGFWCFIPEEVPDSSADKLPRPMEPALACAASEEEAPVPEAALRSEGMGTRRVRESLVLGGGLLRSVGRASRLVLSPSWGISRQSRFIPIFRAAHLGVGSQQMKVALALCFTAPSGLHQLLRCLLPEMVALKLSLWISSGHMLCDLPLQLHSPKRWQCWGFRPCWVGLARQRPDWSYL